MLVHYISYIDFMSVKVVIVCFLPFNSSRTIVSHNYIFHVKGSKKVVDSFDGSFSWKFKGGLYSLVVKTFNLLEFEGLCIHEIVLALSIVNEGSIPEMGDNIGHPAIDDVPLRAFAPFHDVYNLHRAFDLIFNVFQVLFKV